MGEAGEAKTEKATFLSPHFDMIFKFFIILHNANTNYFFLFCDKYKFFSLDEGLVN